MEFEWDEEKSRANQSKHGVDFDTAMKMWKDSNRVEVQISYPFEDRSILIGKIGNKQQYSRTVAMQYALFR